MMRAMARSLVLGVALLPRLASAEPAVKPTIIVTETWLRATPHGAPVAGGYATIVNNGATADRLIGASLPIAPKGEVHAMSMKDGVMHMKRLDDGLTIAPGKTVTLEPGGDHLMFMQPTAQLKQGESVKGSLTFAKAGTILVTYAVAGMAAKSAPGSKPNGHDMSGMSGMH